MARDTAIHAITEWVYTALRYTIPLTVCCLISVSLACGSTQNLRTVTESEVIGYKIEAELVESRGYGAPCDGASNLSMDIVLHHNTPKLVVPGGDKVYCYTHDRVLDSLLVQCQGDAGSDGCDRKVKFHLFGTRDVKESFTYNGDMVINRYKIDYTVRKYEYKCELEYKVKAIPKYAVAR